MNTFEQWVTEIKDEYGVMEVNGEEMLIVSEDTSGLLNVRHRIHESDLQEMFRDVINEAGSLEEVYAEDLRERASANPDAEGDFERQDWGYDAIIDQWVKRGLVRERENYD